MFVLIHICACRGNEEHRRCITACLVKATYVLERDRTKRRNPAQALAPPWWESFHFRHRLDYRLDCPCECALCGIRRRLCSRPNYIYGAVFEYAGKGGARRLHRSSAPSPSYVVAFRGTMLVDPSILHDMRENLGILLNRQHLCARFRHAREMVARLLLEEKAADAGAGRSGGGDVWLAGHSLGASIALDVGRHLMLTGSRGGAISSINLPTFLFNPPHVSLAPVIAEDAKPDVYAVGYFLKHAVGAVLPTTSHKNRMEEVFQKLEPWAPNLYANPRDGFCLGFIDYFEQRELMKKRFPGVAAAAAATLSFRDMFHSALGKQSERQHLLPSATVWKNSSTHTDAHGLQQWWQHLDLTRSI